MTKRKTKAAAGGGLAAGVVERAGYELEKSSRLCSLWAGMGQITEVVVRDDGGKRQILILKEVHPAHGDATAGSVSHMRKVRSYLHEAAFYRQLAPRLAGTPMHIPTALAVECDLEEDKDDGNMALLLTDLRQHFPRDIGGALTAGQAKVVLTALAALHATFWQQELPPHSVWQPCGTYWHLDTRQEELQSMGREWAALQAAAPALDAAVKAPDGASSSRWRTLVHGDAKAANILFAESLDACAFVDFQYCGGGLGTSDVAYFLVSSLPSQLLDREAGPLLRHYYNQLAARLDPGAAADYSFDTCSRLFDVALLDYCRFMAGWGWWGYGSGWARQRAKHLLSRLDQLLPA